MFYSSHEVINVRKFHNLSHFPAPPHPRLSLSQQQISLNRFRHCLSRPESSVYIWQFLDNKTENILSTFSRKLSNREEHKDIMTSLNLKNCINIPDDYDGELTLILLYVQTRQLHCFIRFKDITQTFSAFQIIMWMLLKTC